MSIPAYTECGQLTGNLDALNKLVDKIIQREEAFGVFDKHPVLIPIILFVILTAIYIPVYVTLVKKDWDKKSKKEQSMAIAEGFAIYFAIVLPICLISYAFKLYGLGQSAYKWSYPDAVYPSGWFWGIATLLTLGLVFGSMFAIMSIKGEQISAVLTPIISILVVIIAIIVGLFARVAVDCKLAADANYKKMFRCAEEFVEKHHASRLAAAETSEREALLAQHAAIQKQQQSREEQELLSGSRSLAEKSRAFRTSRGQDYYSKTRGGKSTTSSSQKGSTKKGTGSSTAVERTLGSLIGHAAKAASRGS
jgi:uncharacterized membrane protein (DUF106 family)